MSFIEFVNNNNSDNQLCIIQLLPVAVCRVIEIVMIQYLVMSYMCKQGFKPSSNIYDTTCCSRTNRKSMVFLKFFQIYVSGKGEVDF